MTTALTVYNIVEIISVTLGIFSVLIGILIKFMTMKMEKQWREDLNTIEKACEEKREKDLIYLKQKIDKECSTEAIKGKVGGELKLLEQDVKQIKELASDLKEILSTQQDTLIAIQMSLSELKPRLTSLEERVRKLESTLEKG